VRVSFQESSKSHDEIAGFEFLKNGATRASKAVFLMTKYEPVTQSSRSAAPGSLPVLRACLIFLLGAGLFSAGAWGSPAPKADPAPRAVAAQTADAAGNSYVGGDVCATCHEDVSKKFAGNPHTRLAAQHGAAGVNCEGCHGPGGAHVAGGGDVTKIFNPAKAAPRTWTPSA